MQLRRLRQVALRAPDLDASIAFYRDVLGARFIARFDPPGLAFFDFEGVRLLLERNASTGTLYFEVEDIDAGVAELSGRGVSIESGPAMIHRDEDGTFGPAGEEEWMAFFKDPGGNTLALATRKPSSA
ncbi:MAG: VOC family protein [Gammaproteobacteria bacterium]|nr:VOC family protein [Gammaproteobacteria bacterium]MYE83932.1 VOC family protein [Gammaproteobacteria bacterium]